MSDPHIIINGVAIKNPHSMKVASYNLTKSGRTANGKMAMKIIAKKWTVDVGYEVISAAEMDVILSLIDAGKPFFVVDFLHHGIYKRATMYAGAIDRNMFRTSSGWYWKDVSFAIIEQ